MEGSEKWLLNTILNEVTIQIKLIISLSVPSLFGIKYQMLLDLEVHTHTHRHTHTHTHIAHTHTHTHTRHQTHVHSTRKYILLCCHFQEIEYDFDQCAVCIESYKVSDVIRILPCKWVWDYIIVQFCVCMCHMCMICLCVCVLVSLCFMCVIPVQCLCMCKSEISGQPIKVFNYNMSHMCMILKSVSYFSI